jgi:large subunit ribosomal protein L11
MIVKLIVDGGSMKPGPTVAQQLGPMGINLGKVTEEVNKATVGFKGMKVPVVLDINPLTKDFEISVSSPPVSELIKKEIGVEKGSAEAGTVKVGNISIEQLISVAKTKMPDMLAKDLKAALKLAVGSCVSLGILIESKNAKELIADINSGKYDSEISSEKTEANEEKLKLLKESFAAVKGEQDVAAKAAEDAKLAEEAKKAEVKPEEKPIDPKEKKEDKTKKK